MSSQDNPKIGRFRIERRLGRGLQGTVYLGRDDDLQRPVAIKILHGPTKTVPSQARLLAQLRHPNIISLYDVGMHNNLLYLVFEYIEGPTLDDHLGTQGKFCPTAAIRLISQVADALAHAHSHGIAHLDLSTNNIMLDQGGIARIMDFDLSGQLDKTSGSLKSTLVGTPIYMAPEHFTTRRLDFRTDVYAAGTIFYELLTGQAAINGTDTREIIRNILQHNVDYSAFRRDATLAQCVELLETAMAPETGKRFPNGAALREAFKNLELQVEGPSPHSSDTIGFLLRRMHRRQAFPALSRTLIEINQLTAEDSCASADQLARVILRDITVTNKLLKLANSSFYARSPGQVKSVSDAIRVLGLKQIRIVANGLLCFAADSSEAVRPEVRDLQMHAFLTGLLSRHLAHQANPALAEEAFICGMLHMLGRFLTACYLPEEFGEINERLSAGHPETVAAATVLGVTFDDLGYAVARDWGFPDTLLATMRQLGDEPLPLSDTPDALVHIIVNFAHRICELPLHYPPDQKPLASLVLGNIFGQALPGAVHDVEALLGAAVTKIAEFAPLLDLRLNASPRFQLLKTWLEWRPNTTADLTHLAVKQGHSFSR